MLTAHFQTIFICVFLCGLFITSSVKAELFDPYARANVSAQLVEQNGSHNSQLVSHASRFGVRGDYALNDSTSLIYQFEWQIDLADLTASDTIGDRNQFIGISGDFGQILLGRRDTALKSFTTRVDLFNDFSGDIKQIWKGENRVHDSATYISPTIENINFSISYISSHRSSGRSGVSSAIFYGDPSVKKTDWTIGLAADHDVEGYHNQRIVLRRKIEQWTLGLIGHRQRKVEDQSYDTGVTANVSYKQDKWLFKGQLQTLEDDTNSSVGVDYIFDSSFRVYAWLTQLDKQNGQDTDWLSLGLEKRF